MQKNLFASRIEEYILNKCCSFFRFIYLVHVIKIKVSFIKVFFIATFFKLTWSFLFDINLFFSCSTKNCLNKKMQTHSYKDLFLFLVWKFVWQTQSAQSFPVWQLFEKQVSGAVLKAEHNLTNLLWHFWKLCETQ